MSKTQTELNNNLLTAVRASNATEVETLLNAGADAKATYEFGNSILHFVGSAEITKLLLTAGADAKTSNDLNETPLHKINDPESVHLLVDAGADPKAIDEMGYSTLHASHNTATIGALLEEGADVNAVDPGMRTILDVTDELASLQLIFDHGINIEALNALTFTPLHRSNLGFEKMKLFVANGIDASKLDGSHNSTLHYTEDAQSTQLLLDMGANPLQVNDYGQTPLHTYHKPESVECLLSAGVDPKARDNAGNTALHYAREIETIELLLDAGADVNAAGHGGKMPLDHAYTDAVRVVLINAGASLNIGSGGELLDFAKRVANTDWSTETPESIEAALTQSAAYGLSPMCAKLLEATEIDITNNVHQQAIIVMLNNDDVEQDVIQKYSNTALENNHIEFATTLFCELEIDINSDDGEQLLFMIVEDDNAEALNIILNAFNTEAERVEFINDTQNNLMISAIMQGSMKCLAAAINAGGEYLTTEDEVMDQTSTFTLLKFAAVQGHIQEVQKIVQNVVPTGLDKETAKLYVEFVASLNALAQEEAQILKIEPMIIEIPASITASATAKSYDGSDSDSDSSVEAYTGAAGAGVGAMLAQATIDSPHGLGAAGAAALMAQHGDHNTTTTTALAGDTWYTPTDGHGDTEAS